VLPHALTPHTAWSSASTYPPIPSKLLTFVSCPALGSPHPRNPKCRAHWWLAHGKPMPSPSRFHGGHRGIADACPSGYEMEKRTSMRGWEVVTYEERGLIHFLKLPSTSLYPAALPLSFTGSAQLKWSGREASVLSFLCLYRPAVSLGQV
jgi:hypothetical protein